MQDLLAGRMNFTIDSPTMIAPLMRDGRLRGLAVSSAEPSALVPGLPSLAQSGIANYDMTAWQILFAKPGTPADAMAAVREAALRAVADPAVRQRLANAGVDVWPDPSPEAAAAHLRAEIARWAPIVARMNLTGG